MVDAEALGDDARELVRRQDAAVDEDLARAPAAGPRLGDRELHRLPSGVAEARRRCRRSARDERPREDGGVRPGVAGAADGERATCPGYRQEQAEPVAFIGAASSAWLTSASASAFCARGTRADRPARRTPRSAAIASACSGFMSGCLTLYSPLTCLATSSESLTTSTSVGAERAARVEAEQQAAVLGDVVGRDAEQLGRPRRGPRRRASRRTAAAAAGPGLPRAPPSTWTTTFTRRGDSGVDRRELAGDARAAAVADASRCSALARSRGRRAAPLGLAPVDDDLHVRVVLVVRRRAGRRAPARAPLGRRSRSSARETLRDGLPRATVQLGACSSAAALGVWSAGSSSDSSVPCSVDAHAGGLVAEVDLVAVPATAPSRRRSSRRCPRSATGARRRSARRASGRRRRPCAGARLR